MKKTIILRKPLSRLLCAAALAALAAAASAQVIDPGLWEHRSELSSPDGSSPMVAQMAQVQEQLNLDSAVDRLLISVTPCVG